MQFYNTTIVAYNSIPSSDPCLGGSGGNKENTKSNEHAYLWINSYITVHILYTYIAVYIPKSINTSGKACIILLFVKTLIHVK